MMQDVFGEPLAFTEAALYGGPPWTLVIVTVGAGVAVGGGRGTGVAVGAGTGGAVAGIAVASDAARGTAGTEVTTAVTTAVTITAFEGTANVGERRDIGAGVGEGELVGATEPWAHADTARMPSPTRHAKSRRCIPRIPHPHPLATGSHLLERRYKVFVMGCRA
jgi:hypothetical protein